MYATTAPGGVEPAALPVFDCDAFFAALDAERRVRGLGWYEPAEAEVHAALNSRRRQRGLTWAELARLLDCTPSRLTNLRTARLADMDLTMRVTQWLGRPAADFIHPAQW